MKEFDNIEIKDIYILLNKQTTLQRYFLLIPICSKLTDELVTLNITDKYMFFSKMEENAESFAQKLGIDIDMLKLFTSFLHLHDFINRKLREIESVNSDFIQSLIEDNITTSKDYLLLCMSDNIEKISTKYNVNLDGVIHLFYICDMMRLPGVKDIRSSLYYDCGYKGLQDFANQTVDDMRKNIKEYIDENNINKSLPLKKELSTQIAVAKVLPHIYPKHK